MIYINKVVSNKESKNDIQKISLQSLKKKSLDEPVEKKNKKIFITSKKKEYILIFDNNEYKTNIDLVEKIILLREYIEKNPLIDKINLNKLIKTKTKTIFIEFIINYAKIYPIYKEEELIPKYKKVSRNMKNLLNYDENILFNLLLNKMEIKEKIFILSELSDLCEDLKMNILFDKIANIIAMNIKDKPITKIKECFL